MNLHVGLDVSLDETSICIVDAEGKRLRETKVATDPDAVCAVLSDHEGIVRIGVFGCDLAAFAAAAAEKIAYLEALSRRHRFQLVAKLRARAILGVCFRLLDLELELLKVFEGHSIQFSCHVVVPYLRVMVGG